MRRAALAGALIAAAGAAPAAAHLPPGTPVHDLFALGTGLGQFVPPAPTVSREEPPLLPTPQVSCGAGSRPEPGIQGRVPAGAIGRGLRCNLTELARRGQTGGFKVARHVDRTGRECAFYDTTLAFPLNAIRLDAKSLAVVVLDMTDPSKPIQTATLTDPAMLTPHESLVLNSERGLLAAVAGTAVAAPGIVSLYDVDSDCRQPRLLSSAPLARLGHESGFSPDGNTFYATASNVQTITAIDVRDPRAPHVLWRGTMEAHGMTLSPDGRRAFIADPQDGVLVVADTSEIQNRTPNPRVHEVSRLTWRSVATPQNAIWFTRNGHPYLLEIDEYSAGGTRYGLGDGKGGTDDDIGAARIIDLADERAPKVVAHLRLEVNQPAAHREAEAVDQGARRPLIGYSAHYCGLPSSEDPLVVACSFIASGLRVFDISDLTHPKEIAYHVPAAKPDAVAFGDASAYAMSQPTIVPARREVWYSDATTGLHVLRVDEAVWPSPRPRRCASRRRFPATFRVPPGHRRASSDGARAPPCVAPPRANRRPRGRRPPRPATHEGGRAASGDAPRWTPVPGAAQLRALSSAETRAYRCGHEPSIAFRAAMRKPLPRARRPASHERAK